MRERMREMMSCKRPSVFVCVMCDVSCVCVLCVTDPTVYGCVCVM